MKKEWLIILPITVLVLALAALSMPAMAGTNCDCAVETTTNACNHGTNGTVNGTIYVDGGGESELGQNYLTVDFEDIPAGMNITWARVYWHIWMPGSWTDATFCNATQCWENNQTICDPSESCTCEQDEYDGFYGGGCGTTWVYWNVTNNVTSGEQHNITIDNRAPGADGRTMWVYLVTVVENKTKYSPMHYWVNQGYEDLESGDTTSTWFNGEIEDRDSTLWHLALCSDVTQGGIWFNGHNLHQDIGDMTEEEIPGGDGGYTNDPGPQNMTWDDGDDDWFHPVMAIFMDNVSLRPGKDLKVAGIEFPDVMRPSTGCTIKATIKNQGEEDAEHFNVSLYVNDVLKGTPVNVTSGLTSGSSTEVSFTGVSLSKGCHEFKVFADSNGEVTESMETNNNRTKKYQVGYVIVVESDSDFNALVTESNNDLLGDGNVTKVGNTYYIQNFTGNSAIENCAGSGITIKNLNMNTKFIINNCTILNCTGSGVFLHNLSHGTINGSVIQNNTDYGIEVGLVPLSDEDPDFVNITNSTVKENNLAGIELIGCNFTVRNNTVQNNTQQGIYLFGNDTNITYNNVTDNTGYGVKLFNSTENYVYGNNFTDNRLSNLGHQAWDNRTTNYWNTSAKGNYWSDRVYNLGCPNNYSIDGGNNKDYHPEGPTTASPTCDFSTGAGINKWAYKYEVEVTPDTNNVPSEEFSPGEYTKIAADDNTNYQSNDALNDEYTAAHRFNFSISGNPSYITKINVTWNGKGIFDPGQCEGGSDGAILYIWNKTSGEYDEWDDNSDADDVYLTGENASSAINYISSSSIVTILVKQKGYSCGECGDCLSTIETDYVKLNYTITCQS